MPSTAVLAAAAALPIPGASLVAGAAGFAPSIISMVDPGKARDAARIQRRDFFLNAAKAGSVLATRYLLAGEANVYTVKEKGQYRDGVAEMAQKKPDVLAAARSAGPYWDDAVGAGDMLAVGQRIADELGTHLNVPSGTLGVNDKGAIESWARQFGYDIRQVTSTAVAQAAAGAGTVAAGAIAPPGASQPVLVPTNKATLIGVGLVLIALLFFALRKR